MNYCEVDTCYNLAPCAAHGKQDVRRIVVLGSTGHQGSSVLKVLAQSTQKYQLIGVTRDVNSKSAQTLKKQIPALEFVEGDNDNKESLVRCFRGAWAVYGFTTSDYTSEDHEFKQGKNIADAAEEAKVSIMLWSSTPFAFKVSNGTMKVPGFDTKARIEEYMRGKAFDTIAMIATSFFENIFLLLTPRPDPSDATHKYIVSCPVSARVALAYFSAGDDTGKFVEFALENAAAYAGKSIVMAGDYMSGDDFVRRLGKFFDREIEYRQSSDESFRAHVPHPGVADALMAMFRYYDTYGYGCGGPEVVDSKRGSKFEDWLARHKDEVGSLFSQN